MIFVKFDNDHLDDFFFYKRQIEDDLAKKNNDEEVLRRNVDDFLSMIGLYKSFYSHISGVTIPFAIVKTSNGDSYMFYVSDSEEAIESLKSSLEGCSWEPENLEEIKPLDVAEINGKSKLYWNHKLVKLD